MKNGADFSTHAGASGTYYTIAAIDRKRFIGYIKMEMKKTLILFFILIIAASNTPAQKNKASVAALKQVVESFRKSVIEKDKSLFMSLFFEGNINWQAVREDVTLSRIKIKRPQAIKAPLLPDNTPVSFIDGIVKDTKLSEEKFSNVKIITDGDIASVNFDYIFLYDNRETNRGKEIWSLVRTEKGWKITSVIFSLIFQE